MVVEIKLESNNVRQPITSYSLDIVGYGFNNIPIADANLTNEPNFVASNSVFRTPRLDPNVLQVCMNGIGTYRRPLLGDGIPFTIDQFCAPFNLDGPDSCNNNFVSPSPSPPSN